MNPPDGCHAIIGLWHQIRPQTQQLEKTPGIAFWGFASELGQLLCSDETLNDSPGKLSVYDAREYRPRRQGAKSLIVLLLIAGTVLGVYIKRREIVDYLQRLGASDERAKAAAERVSPLLSAELDAIGHRIGNPIFVRIFKETNELELWVQDPRSESWDFYKTFPICAWSGKLGPKLQEGDGQTPEGFYWVAPRHLNPASSFHLSFNIGYPNTYDRHHQRSGSLIMVHGGCVSVGCFAMTDPAIEELYTLAQAAFDNGQKFFRVHIFPFRMTDRRMDQAVRDKATALNFWANLKEGYDYFEIVQKPPVSNLDGSNYGFE